MLDNISSLTTGQTILLIIIGVLLLAAIALVAAACHETVENRETICAILGVDDPDDQRHVWIQYGKARLPFTLGRPSVIHIAVPDKLAPQIEDMGQAADLGVRMRDSLAMREAEATRGKRRHLWVLS